MYPHERSLVEMHKDQPFALIGVASDSDREALKKTLQQENITWRSFWNGPEGARGPISTAWNVYHAIEALLEELETARGVKTKEG